MHLYIVSGARWSFDPNLMLGGFLVLGASQINFTGEYRKTYVLGTSSSAWASVEHEAVVDVSAGAPQTLPICKTGNCFQIRLFI